MQVGHGPVQTLCTARAQRAKRPHCVCVGGGQLCRIVDPPPSLDAPNLRQGDHGYWVSKGPDTFMLPLRHLLGSPPQRPGWSDPKPHQSGLERSPHHNPPVHGHPCAVPDGTLAMPCSSSACTASVPIAPLRTQKHQPPHFLSFMVASAPLKCHRPGTPHSHPKAACSASDKRRCIIRLAHTQCVSDMRHHHRTNCRVPAQFY